MASLSLFLYASTAILMLLWIYFCPRYLGWFVAAIILLCFGSGYYMYRYEKNLPPTEATLLQKSTTYTCLYKICDKHLMFYAETDKGIIFTYEPSEKMYNSVHEGDRFQIKPSITLSRQLEERSK